LRTPALPGFALLSALAACGASTSTPQTGPSSPVHVAHLSGGTLSAGFACSECHAAPPSTAVDFSQGTMAKVSGLTPTFDATTKTCSNVYCHGNGLPGSSPASVVWDPPSQVTCGSCHAIPPTMTPTAAHPNDMNCGGCHQGYTSTSVNKGLHVNGTIETSGNGACGSCHGLPPATGAHGQHRRGCETCHPSSQTVLAPSHNNGTVDLISAAGYSCGLVGCKPPGNYGTCTNSCHQSSQRWAGGD